MKKVLISSKWPKSISGLSKKPILRAAGLMSGTSADGIDVAIIDFSAKKINILAFDTFGYPAGVRKSIFELFDPQKATIEQISHLDFVLGELFADAVKRLCEKSDIEIGSLDLIGSHGQTIFHNAIGKRFGGKIIRSTFQIAEPCVIAQRTGVLTVADFRTADIAAGGQGAPLVPYTDYILFGHKKKNRIIQNIGGISNFTWLAASGTRDNIIAFDTGPGNMIIDRIAELITKGRQKYDKDGRLAIKGSVNKKLLTRLMQNDFFKRRPPKTAGREQFGFAFADGIYKDCSRKSIGGFDLIATVTAFTANSITEAYQRFIKTKIDEVIVCGGGCRNPVLMRMLGEHLPESRLLIMDELGINADAKEAVSFAILAALTIKGICGNVPSATGAEKPVILGKIIPPQI